MIVAAGAKGCMPPITRAVGDTPQDSDPNTT